MEHIWRHVSLRLQDISRHFLRTEFQFSSTIAYIWFKRSYLLATSRQNTYCAFFEMSNVNNLDQRIKIFAPFIKNKLLNNWWFFFLFFFKEKKIISTLIGLSYIQYKVFNWNRNFNAFFLPELPLETADYWLSPCVTEMLLVSFTFALNTSVENGENLQFWCGSARSVLSYQ